jgi:hypothetical protein
LEVDDGFWGETKVSLVHVGKKGLKLVEVATRLAKCDGVGLQFPGR